MTGKNIRLTIFVILAAVCVTGSVYLFWTKGHFNLLMFLGAWIFAVIGILTYYSEAPAHDPLHDDPYAHDHDDHHGVAHH